MSFWQLASQLTSEMTGGVIGTTLPCQRTKWNPDLLVTLVRADTQAPINGATVRISPALAKTTGSSGQGQVFFTDLAHGDYTISVAFTDPGQQALFIVPPNQNARVRRKRATRVIPVEVVKILDLDPVDHHFAPSRESIQIDYRIQGLSHKTVKLVITSPQYGGNHRVYEHDLTAQELADGTHSITWDGRGSKGPLNGHYIHPLFSPYSVRLLCADVPNGGSQTRQVRVLYHSISIEQGTFTPDGQPPDKVAHLMEWVQYRLNELGYFAGPVDGNKGAQTSRALRRYTYASPGHYMVAMAQVKEHDDETNVALDGQLTNGERPRQLFENEADRLPAAGEQVKAYLSHDYFYTTDPEFMNPMGHMQRDQDKLDPFQLPVEASLLLVGRDDPDGTGAGVDVDPEAIGPVEIEWIVEDPPEDISVLPPAPTAAVPSRGRIYMNLALTATRDAGTGADNCPDANNAAGPVGGGRRMAAHDNGSHFHVGNLHAPWTTQHVGTQVFSTVHQNAVASPQKRGRAGAWFKGSYIAGDNFRIKARIAFARHGNNGTLQADHQALVDLTGRNLDTITDATTGDFTLWRTHHMAALVDWPAPRRAANLAEVAAQYLVAHCELVHEGVPSYGPRDLFPTLADRQTFLQNIFNATPVYRRPPGVLGPAQMHFRDNAIFPYDIPPQGPADTAADYQDILGDTIGWFSMSDPVLEAIGVAIAERVRDLRPAGAVAFRFLWHPPTFVRSEIRIKGYQVPIVGRIKDVVWAYYHVSKSSCFGGPNGVAFLENEMTATEGSYLYAHEMGHCRYMHHDEVRNGWPSSHPLEHDTNDHNCVMSYPDGITSRNPGLVWTVDSATQPRFCGKCILRLRGWNPRDAALPANS